MRKSTTIKRWAVPVGAAALAVMLAACGSNGSGSSASGSGSGSGSTGSAEVSTSDVSGVGTVLVNSSGKTLYTNNQETGGGTLKCTDSCLDFWMPAQDTGTMPTNIQGLGTITRSDNGEKQLTLDGAPLYTFTLDTSAGSAKGNDFQDSFGGTSFTWHAATTSGTSSSDMGGSSGSGESGEYGNNGSGSGSGNSNSNPYSY